jgi:hypothetical protein
MIQKKIFKIFLNLLGYKLDNEVDPIYTKNKFKIFKEIKTKRYSKINNKTGTINIIYIKT